MFTAHLLLFLSSLLLQPRPQDLLVFQYGGGRREDPGTRLLSLLLLPSKKGTGAEMCPTIVSGDAPVSYWQIFSLSLVTIPEDELKINPHMQL